MPLCRASPAGWRRASSRGERGGPQLVCAKPSAPGAPLSLLSEGCSECAEAPRPSPPLRQSVRGGEAWICGIFPAARRGSGWWWCLAGLAVHTHSLRVPSRDPGPFAAWRNVSQQLATWLSIRTPAQVEASPGSSGPQAGSSQGLG